MKEKRCQAEFWSTKKRPARIASRSVAGGCQAGFWSTLICLILMTFFIFQVAPSDVWAGKTAPSEEVTTGVSVRLADQPGQETGDLKLETSTNETKQKKAKKVPATKSVVTDQTEQNIKSPSKTNPPQSPFTKGEVKSKSPSVPLLQRGKTNKLETTPQPVDSGSKDYRAYLKSGHRDPKWNEFIEPAFTAFDTDNLPTAYVLMKKAYDSGCRDGLLLFRYGIYKESRGEYKEAAALLKEAAEKIPKQYPRHQLSKNIYEHAGRALYKADDYDGALPNLLKALKINMDNFLILFMSGQILRMQEKYDDARQMLERALIAPVPKDTQFDPKLKVLQELMIVTCMQRDFEACKSYNTQVLEKDPANKQALNYKQKLEQTGGQMDFMKKQREVMEKITQ